MKTLITTMAIAVLAIGPAMATEHSNKDTLKGFENIGKAIAAPFEYLECTINPDNDKFYSDCNEDIEDTFSENESGETDSEKEVADSGNEGSTSSASANDQ